MNTVQNVYKSKTNSETGRIEIHGFDDVLGRLVAMTKNESPRTKMSVSGEQFSAGDGNIFVLEYADGTTHDVSGDWELHNTGAQIE